MIRISEMLLFIQGFIFLLLLDATWEFYVFWTLLSVVAILMIDAPVRITKLKRKEVKK